MHKYEISKVRRTWLHSYIRTWKFCFSSMLEANLSTEVWEIVIKTSILISLDQQSKDKYGNWSYCNWIQCCSNLFQGDCLAWMVLIYPVNSFTFFLQKIWGVHNWVWGKRNTALVHKFFADDLKAGA